MALNTEIQTVFVRLLNEGTDIMRPALASKVASDSFRLLLPKDYDPEYEEWEFKLGDLVICEARRVYGKQS